MEEKKQIEQKKLYAKKCFQVLKNVLEETFQTNVLFLKPPYKNVSEITAKIDHGMRSIFWSDFNKTDFSIFTKKRDDKKQLFIVKSNLGFYNIIICLEQKEEPDIISIGPFRSEEFSIDFFTKIIKDSKLSANVTLGLKYLYESFPYIQLSSIINVTKCIVSIYFPQFKEMEAVEIAFSDQKNVNKININLELLQDYSADSAELYQKSFLGFLSAIKKGDSTNARNTMQSFLKSAQFLSSENIEVCKEDLKYLNNCCHMALLQSHIHPIYVLKLYHMLYLKINHLKNHETLMGMANDICHKYCLLVKNYGFSEYSKMICDIINYIQLHLDEKLTLSLLAEHFHKNPTSLSNSFSKEVGISVTEFIHQVRINEAIRYFNTTKLSVSEVAIAVGFQDFAYFSRLFKRQIGCSPREYCRNVR